MANIELTEGSEYYVTRIKKKANGFEERMSVQAVFNTKLTTKGRRHIYLTKPDGTFLAESTHIKGGQYEPDHGNPYLVTSTGAKYYFNPPRNTAGKKEYNLPSSR